MRSYRHRIMEWKSTSERYVALVQSAERFEPSSFRELKRNADETWIVGRLKGTLQDDLYAIGLRRSVLEYDEARERAQAAVQRVNELAEQGKNPFS